MSTPNSQPHGNNNQSHQDGGSPFTEGNNSPLLLHPHYGDSNNSDVDEKFLLSVDDDDFADGSPQTKAESSLSSK